MDFGWFIGLFEGEGCISLRGCNGVFLRISSTDFDVVEKVYHLMGGTLYGPRELPGRKPYWTWGLGTADAVENLLRKMLPYLGNRRLKKAEEALYRLEGMSKWRRDVAKRRFAQCGKETQ